MKTGPLSKSLLTLLLVLLCLAVLWLVSTAPEFLNAQAVYQAF